MAQSLSQIAALNQAGICSVLSSRSSPLVTSANQILSELIGKTFVVHEAIVDGQGKIKVVDGVWMARGQDARVWSANKARFCWWNWLTERSWNSIG